AECNLNIVTPTQNIPRGYFDLPSRGRWKSYAAPATYRGLKFSDPESPMQFDDLLHARKSVRVFKPDPVPLELVTELLALASRAPSGTNVQPWKVHVVAGEVRARLEAEVLAYRETENANAAAEFPRTSKRKEPYTTRMR